MRIRHLSMAAILTLTFVSLAQGEVIQKGNLRVSLEGQIIPKALPRSGSAPVKVSLATKIAAVNGKTPPPLQRIEIAINRHGHLEPKGLPLCEVDDIQPSTTQKALEACGPSLVGRGHFSAEVLLPEQSAFPSEGEMFAFNGSFEGKPAILAHVYGTDPIPTSFTLPFAISHAKGTFATVLSAKLPTDSANSVTAIELRLQRRFKVNGVTKSYAVAACPAPEGFPGATFPFARARYEFVGGRGLSTTLRRSCGVRG